MSYLNIIRYHITGKGKYYIQLVFIVLKDIHLHTKENNSENFVGSSPSGYLWLEFIGYSYFYLS